MSESNGHFRDDGLLEVAGVKADAWLIYTAGEELVDKHHLKIENERYKVTVKFSQELHNRLTDLLGNDELTMTVAGRLWQASCAFFAEAQKKTK